MPTRIPLTREGLRRLAQLGFWFFLVKGLLWLLLPALALWLGWRADWF
jgi:hypothetical protein